MTSSIRSTSFLRYALMAAVAAVAVLVLPTKLHASTIDYNLTLTPYEGSLYGGTGTLEIASAPVASGVSNYTVADGGLLGLSFNIDGQTFSLAGDMGALVQFINGSIWDITFAQTLGSSPNRFTLDTTGNYAFYYNNGQSASYGSFTASPASDSQSPVPEPSTLALLATGLLGGAASIRRRFLVS